MCSHSKADRIVSMKIWMSGEVQADVYDGYVNARKKIEAVFNAKFSEKDFGLGVIKLAYVGILRAIDSQDFDEVKKYRKREQTVEFRLKIPHNVFLLASDPERIELVAASLLRAVKWLPEMQIKDFDCETFEAEVILLFQESGWLTRPLSAR
jgi:hypothetical protein